MSVRGGLEKAMRLDAVGGGGGEAYAPPNTPLVRGGVGTMGGARRRAPWSASLPLAEPLAWPPAPAERRGGCIGGGVGDAQLSGLGERGGARSLAAARLPAPPPPLAEGECGTAGAGLQLAALA